MLRLINGENTANGGVMIPVGSNPTPSAISVSGNVSLLANVAATASAVSTGAGHGAAGSQGGLFYGQQGPFSDPFAQHLNFPAGASMPGRRHGGQALPAVAMHTTPLQNRPHALKGNGPSFPLCSRWFGGTTSRYQGKSCQQEARRGPEATEALHSVWPHPGAGDPVKTDRRGI